MPLCPSSRSPWRTSLALQVSWAQGPLLVSLYMFLIPFPRTLCESEGGEGRERELPIDWLGFQPAPTTPASRLNSHSQFPTATLLPLLINTSYSKGPSPFALTSLHRPTCKKFTYKSWLYVSTYISHRASGLNLSIWALDYKYKVGPLRAPKNYVPTFSF